ncbi:MAG: Fe-S protein assembly co-chaperone HscB [Rickettsiales bacterium]|nr:Fe-S protein assembly co-chaperone HscB [Rickettsiales bacterium]
MINHFKNFGFGIDFKINLEELENKYLEFQKQFHPDNGLFADVTKSIAINESYAILKNPIRRAAHILQLQNIDIENDEKAPKPDFETLEEILELQEKLAEISEEEKSQLKKYLTSKIKDLLEIMSQELDNKAFEKSAQILIRAKYFDKTLQDLKSKK